MIAGVALGKWEFRGVGGISILDAHTFPARIHRPAPHHFFFALFSPGQFRAIVSELSGPLSRMKLQSPEIGSQGGISCHQTQLTANSLRLCPSHSLPRPRLP
jgi:hypothetical protein